MAQEMTQIVAAFLPSNVYSSPTWMVVPPQAIPIQCQMEYTSVQSPTYGFLVGALSAQDRRPDFNNGLGGYLNSGPVMAPAFIWVRLE